MSAIIARLHAIIARLRAIYYAARGWTVLANTVRIEGALHIMGGAYVAGGTITTDQVIADKTASKGVLSVAWRGPYLRSANLFCWGLLMADLAQAYTLRTKLVGLVVMAVNAYITPRIWNRD